MEAQKPPAQPQSQPGLFSLNTPIPPASLPSSPVPQCDLSLPTSSSLPPALTTVIASLSSVSSSPSSRTKDGLIRMLLQSSSNSQETSTSPDPALARSVSLIQLDHSYSKPWNWRPESCLCQPTKTLFVPGTERTGALESEVEEGEVYVDVVTEPAKQIPVYDKDQAEKLMGECERFLDFAKPSFCALDGKEEEDDMVGWEERIPKENWSAGQSKVFGRVMKVLCQDRLARLAEAGGDHEPLLRRLTIDKSCRRLRSVLASPPCVWDHHLLQWLHNTLSNYLPSTLLAAWLDILQALRSKVPNLMERLLANAGHHIDPKARSLAQEGLSLLLRRPWDPAASSITSRRLARLPGNPILIVAPPGPDIRDGKTISKRMRMWNTQLGCLGKVIVINMPPPRSESAARTGVNFYLHQMVTTTLNKVREIRNSSEGRPVVLLGWGPGAAIAAHVSSIEKLGGLVCLGFPVSTLAGTRGQVGDTLLDLKTPGLFIVGERASQCNSDDVEDIRERMSVETGLVIVGGADDQLRLTNKKKKSELVTQGIVDRFIIDQIRNFLVSVLVKQPQTFADRGTSFIIYFSCLAGVRGDG